MQPIARNPGAFDLNVRPDTRQLRKQKSNRDTDLPPSRRAPDEPETLNVMPREILMAKNQNGSRYRDRHMLHCFSSANGLGAQDQGDDSILDELVYAGVSVTGYDLHHDKQRESQGFVSSLGGLNTIINTGRCNIYPGDVLRVGLPHNEQKPAEGVPPEKKMFSVEPARVADKAFADNLFREGGIIQRAGVAAARGDIEKSLGRSTKSFLVALKELQGLAEGAAVDASERLARAPDRQAAMHVLNAALSIARTRRRLEIGRALSFAPPGHDMDVVLM